MSDPAKYRTREELEERKKKDPVRIARDRLAELGASEEDLDAIDDAVEEEIQDAIRFADESEAAKEEVMFDAVYAPAGGGGEP